MSLEGRHLVLEIGRLALNQKLGRPSPQGRLTVHLFYFQPGFVLAVDRGPIHGR
jgi:hypothetical protein